MAYPNNNQHYPPPPGHQGSGVPQQPQYGAGQQQPGYGMLNTPQQQHGGGGGRFGMQSGYQQPQHAYPNQQQYGNQQYNNPQYMGQNQSNEQRQQKQPQQQGYAPRPGHQGSGLHQPPAGGQGVYQQGGQGSGAYQQPSGAYPPAAPPAAGQGYPQPQQPGVMGQVYQQGLPPPQSQPPPQHQYAYQQPGPSPSPLTYGHSSGLPPPTTQQQQEAPKLSPQIIQQYATMFDLPPQQVEQIWIDSRGDQDLALASLQSAASVCNRRGPTTAAGHGHSGPPQAPAGVTLAFEVVPHQQSQPPAPAVPATIAVDDLPPLPPQPQQQHQQPPHAVQGIADFTGNAYRRDDMIDALNACNGDQRAAINWLMDHRQPSDQQPSPRAQAPLHQTQPPPTAQVVQVDDTMPPQHAAPSPSANEKAMEELVRQFPSLPMAVIAQTLVNSNGDPADAALILQVQQSTMPPPPAVAPSPPVQPAQQVPQVSQPPPPFREPFSNQQPQAPPASLPPQPGVGPPPLPHQQQHQGARAGSDLMTFPDQPQQQQQNNMLPPPPMDPQPQQPGPLMSEEERAEATQIFKKQFQINADFLGAGAALKIKMAAKARQARARVAERHASSSSTDFTGGGLNPNSPQPCVLSFANYQDSAAVAQSATREEKIRDGIKLIGQRIEHLNLSQIPMKDDGNCQFRSLAHQLRGDADQHHAAMREQVLGYLVAHADSFSFFVGDDAEWQRYLDSMRRLGTWGDELTLKAASNVFNARIHVLTSDQEHYYVCYKPEAGPGEGGSPPIDVFLAYISPIHYNSIRFVPGMVRRQSSNFA